MIWWYLPRFLGVSRVFGKFSLGFLRYVGLRSLDDNLYR